MATVSRRTQATSATGKVWDGRFREKTNRLVEAFTVSVAVDRRLYAHDIQGSIAHCKTLGKARVLTPGETRTIVRFAFTFATNTRWNSANCSCSRFSWSRR